jgi:hypothetical protein
MRAVKKIKQVGKKAVSSKSAKKQAKKTPNLRQKEKDWYEKEIEIPVKIVRAANIKRAYFKASKPEFLNLANVAAICYSENFICKERNEWLRESANIFAGRRKKSFIRQFAGWLKAAGSAVLILALLVGQTFAVSGFEAHIINVTAHICGEQSEIRSMGYWKNHSEVYSQLLPQMLGGIGSEDQLIENQTEVDQVFGAADSVMRNKLKKQLLTMKFNIAYFSIGDYLVEAENKTLSQLVVEADNLLAQDPPPLDIILENLKDLLESVNILEKIRFCAVPTPTPSPTPTPTPSPTPTPECPCPPSNDCNNVVVNNAGDAAVSNDIRVAAGTGLNVAAGNSGGNEDIVSTGNATAASVLINVVNTGITDICNCQNSSDNHKDNHSGEKCKENNKSNRNARGGRDSKFELNENAGGGNEASDILGRITDGSGNIAGQNGDIEATASEILPEPPTEENLSETEIVTDAAAVLEGEGEEASLLPPAIDPDDSEFDSENIDITESAGAETEALADESNSLDFENSGEEADSLPLDDFVLAWIFPSLLATKRRRRIITRVFFQTARFQVRLPRAEAGYRNLITLIFYEQKTFYRKR